MEKAFAFVRPETVIIARDKTWNRVFREGTIMQIDGGTMATLVSEDHTEVVIQLDDPYYPPVKCRISKMRPEHQNLLTPTPARAQDDPARYTVQQCDHQTRTTGCRGCWVKYWQKEAAELGIVIPHIGVPVRWPWEK